MRFQSIDRDTYTAEEALHAGGLAWNVDKVPALTPTGRSIPGVFGLVRSDTGEPVGNCGRAYTPFQNAELAYFLEAFRVQGCAIVQAGELRQGGLVYATLRLPGSAIGVKRMDGRVDIHERNIVIAHTHGGGMGKQLPIVIRETTFRLSCENQLPSFLRGTLQRQDPQYVQIQGWRIPHRSAVAERVDAAREVIAKSLTLQDDFLGVLQNLAETPMSRSTFRLYAEELMRETRGLLGQTREQLSTRTRNALDADVAELESLFVGGAGNTGESAYDAVNAVTEWVDHKRRVGRAGAATAAGAALDARRFERATFGDGLEVKARAVRLLTR